MVWGQYTVIGKMLFKCNPPTEKKKCWHFKAFICISTSSDFDSTDNPVVVPITFGIFKKQRPGQSLPSIQRQLVSRKALSVCEVCIPRANSKDRLLTVVSELISSYKDGISDSSGELSIVNCLKVLIGGRG